MLLWHKEPTAVRLAMTNPDRPQEAPMLIIAHPRDELFLERLPFHIDLDPELVEMDRVLDDQKLILAATNFLNKHMNLP